jgi:hypothetical protein
MRKPAEAVEAASVFTATGSVAVDSYESSTASVPLFAAVSPKRESGPCTGEPSAATICATGAGVPHGCPRL